MCDFKWITLLLAKVLVLENCKRKVILLYIYRWFSTVDSMEDNTNYVCIGNTTDWRSWFERYQQSSETATI